MMHSKLSPIYGTHEQRPVAMMSHILHPLVLTSVFLAGFLGSLTFSTLSAPQDLQDATLIARTVRAESQTSAPPAPSNQTITVTAVVRQTATN